MARNSVPEHVHVPGDAANCVQHKSSPVSQRGQPQQPRKVSWGPGGPGLSLTPARAKGAAHVLGATAANVLTAPSVFLSPGPWSRHPARLPRCCLCPVPFWGHAAAALLSDPLRLSPSSSLHSVPDQLPRVCTQRPPARRLCVQLPDLHALMLIVWKRVMVGFVLSFPYPELSSAREKETSPPLDWKEFKRGSFQLLLTWFSNSH